MLILTLSCCFLFFVVISCVNLIYIMPIHYFILFCLWSLIFSFFQVITYVFKIHNFSLELLFPYLFVKIFVPSLSFYYIYVSCLGSRGKYFLVPFDSPVANNIKLYNVERQDSLFLLLTIDNSF